MKLILCVDRDDDLGRKTKISSPILGRKKNLDAVIKLGLRDPEDPDTNALLKAISLYDDLKSRGEDVKIATVCGSSKASLADRVVTKQVERILGEVKPTSAIVVADGAEDEYVMPLITSRVKVDSLQRVIVKQAQNIESTYYMLVKALKDEKVQKKFIVPSALIFLTLGICVVAGYPYVGWGAIGIVLGIYLMVRAFNLESALVRIGGDFKTGLQTGRISLFTSLVAVLIILLGFSSAWTTLVGHEITIQLVANFGGNMLWWVIGAALICIAGKVTDTYLKERKILWSYWIVPFSLVIMGIIVSLALEVLNRAGEGLSIFIGEWFIYRVLLIIILAAVGIYSYRYIRENLMLEEVEWRR